MIALTAPTSNIGRQVLRRVVESGAVVRVIARCPSRLPQDLRSRIDIVTGSHADPEVIDRGLVDIDTLFWLVPADPSATSVEDAYVGFSQPATAAIRKRGVARVVVITALGRGTTQAETAGHVTASLHMGDLLATTGADLMEVTNPSFMNNIARQASSLRSSGLFFGPIDGDRSMPVCATRDIAVTSAELLLDRSWSGRGQRAVLGPDDLSFNDMAAIMSDVLGKIIQYRQISFDHYTAQFTGMGMSEAMAKAMTEMAKAKNNGLDNAEARTLTNTTPTSFRTWCEEELRPALAA